MVTASTDEAFVLQLASELDTSKHRLPGSDRACPPNVALTMALDASRRVGITRIADITALDVVGIPTFQAIRPMSRTIAVSQGKGATKELAKLSALMEAIEIWHVEQPMPVTFRASPRDVGATLTYDVHGLAQSTPSLLHDGLPLDWMPARSLRDGTETLVPTDVVRLSLVRRNGWHPPVFFESTNGLASGNTRVEAALHALYEVIERDATTAAVSNGDLGTRVDPLTLSSPLVDGLMEKIARAKVYLETRYVPSPTGLPVFISSLRCDDYPLSIFGFGCHLSSEIALSRSITEAAQARLGHISSAREDIDANAYKSLEAPPPPTEPSADVGATVPSFSARARLVDDLDEVSARAADAFGHSPLLVDLTREDIGVPVVKIIAPGSRVSSEVL